MCGILGIVSKEPIKIKDALNRLKRLEYRGYDSAGIASASGFFLKKKGDIDSLLKVVQGINSKDKVIIAHTRWATHGEVSDINSHPHLDCSGEIMIVHNGIIENYKELRKHLEKRGHIFRSETDSEVIAHLIEDEVRKGKDLKDAALQLFRKLKGTYAILILKKGENRVIALRKDSPLVIGLSNPTIFISSDVHTFLDLTQKVILLSDYELAEITENSIRIFNKKGNLIKKKIKNLTLVELSAKKREFEHFMLKEIFEQPLAAKILIESLEGEQGERIDKLCELIEKSKNIVFLGAGSSYHASLIGAYLLRKLGFLAEAILASEYQLGVYDKETLLIPVSQSGETMDVLLAVKNLRKKVFHVFSVLNIPYSSLERLSDSFVYINAGLEKCVAATKTYTNQVLLFLLLAKKLGLRIPIRKAPNALQEIIEKNEERSIKIAKEIKNEESIYIIGRGINLFAGMEIALKLKEISYIHAEVLAGGELKHGTLALIEPGTKVLSLNPKWDKRIESNMKEIESRGGKIYSINKNGDFVVPEDKFLYPVYAVICGQLLTYYTAKERGLPIDKPRNLAKTITVF